MKRVKANKVSEAECIPRNRVVLPARATKARGGIKITPFVGGKGTVEVEGKRSPVRFATDSKPEFVFQAAQNVDPQSVAQIVTFTVKKGHRELITIQTHGFMGLGGARSSRDKEAVSVPGSATTESSVGGYLGSESACACKLRWCKCVASFNPNSPCLNRLFLWDSGFSQRRSRDSQEFEQGVD